MSRITPATKIKCRDFTLRLDQNLWDLSHLFHCELTNPLKTAVSFQIPMHEFDNEFSRLSPVTSMDGYIKFKLETGISALDEGKINLPPHVRIVRYALRKFILPWLESICDDNEVIDEFEYTNGFYSNWGGMGCRGEIWQEEAIDFDNVCWRKGDE